LDKWAQERRRQLNAMFDVMSKSDSLALDAYARGDYRLAKQLENENTIAAEPFRERFNLAMWAIQMTTMSTKTEYRFSIKFLDQLALTAYERQDYRTARWLEATSEEATRKYIYSAYWYPFRAEYEFKLREAQKRFRIWRFFGYKLSDCTFNESYSLEDFDRSTELNRRWIEDRVTRTIADIVYTKAIRDGNYAVASAAAKVNDMESKNVGGRLLTRPDYCKKYDNAPRCTFVDRKYLWRDDLFIISTMRSYTGPIE